MLVSFLDKPSLSTMELRCMVQYVPLSTLEILFTTVRDDKSADGCQSRCSDIARLNRTGEPQLCGYRKQSWMDDLKENIRVKAVETNSSARVILVNEGWFVKGRLIQQNRSLANLHGSQ